VAGVSSTAHRGGLGPQARESIGRGGQRGGAVDTGKILAELEGHVDEAMARGS
jgi:hypothetical protein